MIFVYVREENLYTQLKKTFWILNGPSKNEASCIIWFDNWVILYLYINIYDNIYFLRQR